jgi:hypothetical protein
VSEVWLRILFNDAFSGTRLYNVDDRIVSEWWWIGSDLVGSGHGLVLRHYPGIRLEGLGKTTKNLNQDSWSLGPRIEPGTFWIRNGCGNGGASHVYIVTELDGNGVKYVVNGIVQYRCGKICFFMFIISFTYYVWRGGCIQLWHTK